MQKELGLNSLIFSICIIALLGLAFLHPTQVHAETMGSIAVNLSYSNGDIADYFPVSLKIYQDSSTVPYREIEFLSGNPFNIVSLPTGHQYKIASYVDGLHATDSYVNLQKSHEDLNIKLPLSGGMRLDVFYNDGATPIPDATVNIVSLDNKTWAQGSTNINGQTLRFWLEPTDFESDHYVVNVKVGNHLVYSQSPVFLIPGIAQEIKIVTNWPPVINSLITIKLLDANQNPLVSNGNLTVDAFDSSGNKISQSPVTTRGEAYFSNFKVGDYQFKAKTNDSTVLASLNATIDGSKTTFILYENPKVLPQINSTTTSPQSSHPPAICNCVAFRIDNIQDYWLDNVQAKVIDTFYQKNAEQTLGIIGNAFGNDSKLVDKIKAESGDMDIAINGWNFEDFTALGMQQQSLLLDQSEQKISSLFGVTPSVFIPPYGKADNNTFYAMSNSSIIFLSASPGIIPPPPLEEKFHLFPTNVILGNGINTNETDLSKIKNAISNYGFAVATLNFQDYAQNNGTDKINLPNATKIQKLGDLIDEIENDGIKIVMIKKIDNQTYTKTQIPSWVKNTAGWWAQGKVGDGDFVKGIQYLIGQGILQIPQTLPATQQTLDGIKNTAGLWASGQASDDEFGKVIQSLISNGITQ
ncbi:MAG: polysaccharide deacetylase family protein [Nitrosotalea sp.]